jgi:hypothetical protein
MSNIQDIQKQILIKQIEQAQEQFSELDKRNVRSIPENMFVHHFLPFFSGETTENAQESITNWITIAGSPMHPVNIVNSQGQVVAQVPPINNNGALDPTGKDTNIAYAMKEAKSLSGLSPNAGQNLILGKLSEKLDAMTAKATDNQTQMQERWNDLLKHYNKKPIGAAAANDKQQTDESDVFGF